MGAQQPVCPHHSGTDERLKSLEKGQTYQEETVNPDLYTEIKKVRSDMERNFRALYKTMVATLLTALGGVGLMVVDLMMKHVSGVAK